MARFIDAAKRLYDVEGIDFVDNPPILAEQDGAWVQAFVFVPNTELGGNPTE